MCACILCHTAIDVNLFLQYLNLIRLILDAFLYPNIFNMKHLHMHNVYIILLYVASGC